jgi:hypothetical protein
MVNFEELKIIIKDEFDNPIVDIKGKPKKIKEVLKLIDKKFG